jgi:hypothetical protein
MLFEKDCDECDLMGVRGGDLAPPSRITSIMLVFSVLRATARRACESRSCAGVKTGDFFLDLWRLHGGRLGDFAAVVVVVSSLWARSLCLRRDKEGYAFVFFDIEEGDDDVSRL